jgi:hypothetical protein
VHLDSGRWVRGWTASAVLLKIYAYCLHGQADAANKRITDTLSDAEAPEDEVSGE